MEHAVDIDPVTTSRVTTVRVVYLARLREVLGCASETLAVASDAAPSVADLVHALRKRGGVWAHELGVGRAVRFAVNQRLARPDTPIGDDDEVAVFPPVTGG
ncbi:MAG TPA: MoaD/ThiS family protein [Casimicrobiaceae bacterium]